MTTLNHIQDIIQAARDGKRIMAVRLPERRNQAFDVTDDIKHGVMDMISYGYYIAPEKPRLSFAIVPEGRIEYIELTPEVIKALKEKGIDCE